MIKVIKKILLSLLLLSVPLTMYFLDDYNIGLISFIIILLFLLWAFDINTFSNLSFDLNKKKIEISKSVEETKKIANEVAVTASAFDKTIKAFLNFNLSDLQMKGRAFVKIDWKDAAKFINESIELNNFLGGADEETISLIMKGKCKVIDLFQMDSSRFFPEQKINIDEYTSCGFEIKDEIISYDIKKVAIDFNGLYSLKDRVPEHLKLQWKKEIDELKEFYDKNF